MIDIDVIRKACEDIRSAALMGQGWTAALEDLSRAAGARGVMIMHNRDRRLVAHVSTEGVREPVDAYLAGKAPPNARQTKVNHDFDDGFRVDYDDFDDSQIARDPFYQDYLRPIGLRWHANARLQMSRADEIAVSFKRDLKAGPYSTADKATLDRILPSLRTSATLAEYVMEAETRGALRALHRRGRPALEFDAFGRARRNHGDFEALAGPLRLRSGRAVAARPDEQGDLDKAIELATRPPHRSASARLTDRDGGRHLFRLSPVVGAARDVFDATSAIGVLISRPQPRAGALDLSIAIELFALAPRETRVAELLCEGLGIAEIARCLQIAPDTVRYHLKSIFEKTGARRQAEAVAILLGLQ